MKSLLGRFIDPTYDLRANMPKVLGRAAVRTAVLVVVALVLMTGAAYAAGDPTGASTGTIADVTAATPGAPTLAEVAGDLGHLKIATNVFFIIMGTALIFFMQAGFMLVETGFCRSKNAAHVAMTNFVIFAVGALAYWAGGFALQFGGLGGLSALGGATSMLDKTISLGSLDLAGFKGFFVGSLGDGTYDAGVFAFFLFQLVFMDTAATIVTGAMAERWKFSAFVPFGVFMALVTYPIYGMWVWGGGWLADLGANAGLGHGVVDFAGSSVVHATGGFSALAGALVLVFGWMGFNGMSTLAAGDMRFPIIIGNTILAAGAGCVAAMFLVWKLWGKPDPSMSANGMLAGMVAITAPCAFVAPWAAVAIGTVAGVLVVYSVLFWERVVRVDDPVGAISVHGVNGLWGMLALGIFADGSYGAGWNGVEGGVRGLLYGDAGQLAAQGVGVVVVAAWAFATMYAFFRVQDAVMGIRSTEADELAGLDATEMGVLAYPDFAGSGVSGAGAATGVPHPHGALKPQPQTVAAGGGAS